jgi:hypothetical protein
MVDFTNYLNDYLSDKDFQSNKRPRIYSSDNEENYLTTEILYFSSNDLKPFKRPRIHSYDYEEFYTISSETSNSSSKTFNLSSKRVAFDSSIKNYDGLREDHSIFLKICKNEEVSVTNKIMLENLLILTKDLIIRIKEASENNISRVYILNEGGSHKYISKLSFDTKLNDLQLFETELINRIKNNIYNV